MLKRYQEEGGKIRKNRGAFLWMTFFIALTGSYFSQIYLKDIFGRQEESVEKLSYLAEENGEYVTNTNTKENMLENAMRSVVGISKLQANEESIFDVSLSQKWGMRNRSHCL